MTMMCHCRLTDNKEMYQSGVGSDREGGGRGQEFTRELSVLSTHFISEPKTVLKIKYSYFF